ncbi:DUF5325 family protein [Paenibacillus koleovorans]|uniref:DUF5325 family protein n=1 Tax=Paenibacillus koleovorans TaxID=121608 RepID=UPI0013E3AEAB|nr:DUF5325 family protein [Paenibacillus koleovorans]
MNRSLALVFAVVTVALLCGVSFSISYSPLLAVLFGVAAFLFMGYGFALSARMRRQRK